MKKASTRAKKLTDKQKAELGALEALPDDQIDTSDIPEVPDWSDARRGLFYRPVKQWITSRIFQFRSSMGEDLFKSAEPVFDT